MPFTAGSFVQVRYLRHRSVLAELAAVSGVTGVEGDNEAAYQAYINENPLNSSAKVMILALPGTIPSTLSVTNTWF